MTRWLHSGLRRDVCFVVSTLDRPTEQGVKRTLESHYDERIEPGEFRGALEALVDTGHLATEPDSVHDRYWLTDAGDRALERHREWVCASNG